MFNVGSGNGVDGECSDPDQVPECRDYYGDQDFDPRTLANQGFDTGSRVRTEMVLCRMNQAKSAW